MNIPKDTPVILQGRFDDFDAMTDAARQWDLDFLQLDRGPFVGEILQAAAGALFFSEARFGRQLEQRGVAPTGMRTFAVPAADDVRFLWRRQNVEPTDVLLFPRSGELHAISQPDFHVFTISLPERLLYDAAELYGVTDVDGLLHREKVSCPVPLAKRLRLVLHRFRECVTKRIAPALLEDLESDLPSLLIRALNVSGLSRNDSPSPNRVHTVARAKEYIAAHQNRPLTVRELCRVAGVSERTLQYAFLEHFGVTPKAYLKAVRLNGARKSLRRADPTNTTITRVAGQWGFWHMGQFATDYRRQFSELPSQTLASKPD